MYLRLPGVAPDSLRSVSPDCASPPWEKNPRQTWARCQKEGGVCRALPPEIVLFRYPYNPLKKALYRVDYGDYRA